MIVTVVVDIGWNGCLGYHFGGFHVEILFSNYSHVDRKVHVHSWPGCAKKLHQRTSAYILHIYVCMVFALNAAQQLFQNTDSSFTLFGEISMFVQNIPIQTDTTTAYIDLSVDRDPALGKHIGLSPPIPRYPAEQTMQQDGNRI